MKTEVKYELRNPDGTVYACRDSEQDIRDAASEYEMMDSRDCRPRERYTLHRVTTTDEDIT